MKIQTYIIYTIISILAVVFQLSLINYFSIHPLIYLPLILFTVVCISRTLLFTLSQSLLMGVLLDIFSPLQLGTHTILFLFLTGIGYLLIQTIFSQRSLVSIFFLGIVSVFLYTLGLEIIQYISWLNGMGTSPIFFQGRFFFNLFVASLSTSTMAVLLYKLFSLRRGYHLQPYIIK